MNLLASSLNNEERGRWSNETADLAQCVQYAQQLLSKSEDARSAVAPAKYSGARIPQRPASIANKPHPGKPGFFGSIGDMLDDLMDVDDGTCIRCSEEIEFNPYRPLCSDCYSSWARFKNYNYAENYCHDCGNEDDTCMARPLCYDCWQDS